MLSDGAIRFEDFCTSKKGGIGGGMRFSIQDAVDVAAALAACRKALVSTRGAVDMAATLAGYRKALVGTGWTISHLDLACTPNPIMFTQQASKLASTIGNRDATWNESYWLLDYTCRLGSACSMAKS